MKLTFWGAAQQVTGSMYLLELEDDYKILIDCGIDMDRDREDASEDIIKQTGSTIFPFEPSSINLVLLTHAHIDHSGNIPNLIREGYEGQILCTSPTYALTQILLMDSAALHRRKLKSIHSGKRNYNYQRRSRGPVHIADTSALYLEQQVDEAVERFVTLPFNRKFKIKKGLDVTFVPTGHLLGAASIYLEVYEDGIKKTIGFSGDIGRKNYPLLVDPHPFPEVDYLVCESTYGNRQHSTEDKPEDILADIIKRACIDIPGRLIIPAFSVGRTQALLYTLNKLYTEHNFQPIKVFSDSPLALQSTKVYEKYTKHLNEEAQAFYEANDELFDFRNLHYVENMAESKAISNYNEPCIIISSSGMVRGGRVEQHIKANIQNPYCTILMIGYAAEGTLGHKLMNGAKHIQINNKELSVNATIATTDRFSGHGDLDDLVDFVKHQPADKLQKLFLVHGDLPSMNAFKSTLATEGYTQVEIPTRGQSFVL